MPSNIKVAHILLAIAALKATFALLAIAALAVFSDPRMQAAARGAWRANDNRAQAALSAWKAQNSRYERHLDEVERRNPGLHVRGWLTAGY